jgi:hypothetical protein
MDVEPTYAVEEGTVRWMTLTGRKEREAGKRDDAMHDRCKSLGEDRVKRWSQHRGVSWAQKRRCGGEDGVRRTLKLLVGWPAPLDAASCSVRDCAHAQGCEPVSTVSCYCCVY